MSTLPMLGIFTNECAGYGVYIFICCSVTCILVMPPSEQISMSIQQKSDSKHFMRCSEVLLVAGIFCHALYVSSLLKRYVSGLMDFK